MLGLVDNSVKQLVPSHCIGRAIYLMATTMIFSLDNSRTQPWAPVVLLVEGYKARPSTVDGQSLTRSCDTETWIKTTEHSTQFSNYEYFSVQYTLLLSVKTVCRPNWLPRIWTTLRVTTKGHCSTQPWFQIPNILHSTYQDAEGFWKGSDLPRN